MAYMKHEELKDITIPALDLSGSLCMWEQVGTFTHKELGEINISIEAGKRAMWIEKDNVKIGVDLIPIMEKLIPILDEQLKKKGG